MRDFIDIVNEAFDRKSVNWAKRSDKEWEGSFEVQNTKFEITIFKRRNDEAEEWGLFFHDSKESTINTGRMGPAASLVFGFVISAIEDFLTQMEPDYLDFSGDKYEGKAILYAHMAKALTPRLNALGYRCVVNDGDVRNWFTIRRGVSNT